MLNRRTHKTELEDLRKLLTLAGGVVYVMHQGPGRGRRRGLWGSAGVPDMLCFIGGEPVWIEVKVGSDRLRPAQAEFRSLAERAGMRVIVGGVDEALAFLREKGRAE